MKTNVKEITIKEKRYILDLSESEVGILIHLMSEVRGDWYYDNETDRILEQLKRFKKNVERK